MSTTAHALARAALLGGVALVTAAVTATPAGAASEEVEYSCEFSVSEASGEGTGTASFDSGIADGLVVDVGTRVSLDPFVGTITLPEEFVSMLRDAGMTTIVGGGEIFAYIAEAEDEFFPFFEFDETAVPAEGPLVLEVEGEAGRFRPQDPGVYTLLGGDFFVFVDTGDEDGPGAGMECFPADDEDVVIDELEATEAATPPPPTTTVTATATAVRPVVVQTDFADEQGRAVPPVLAAGALLTLVAGAVGAGRRGRLAAGRRH
ncbi:MAG TPA: DUF6801 domain-containing protein [Ornithinibacter sp.]|nr:DUF6801 domain-containing protein [Ornithinibacter sp.]